MLRQEAIEIISRLPEAHLKIITDYLKTIEKQSDAAVQPEQMSDARDRSGADFLLSVAGMFDSGMNNTSEQVNTVVSDFIMGKYNDRAD